MAPPSLARAQASRPLDILVLGGTGFVGPQQVEHALSRGHRVTLFNRGKRARGLFGDRVEELLGDRDGRKPPGLTALQGPRRWDVVIDNSGFFPRHVRDSVELLGARCTRYIYVSTLSVYELAGHTRVEESSKLHDAPDPSTEQITNENYGPLKAECDRIVQSLGDQATIVRPTYIVGPGDPSDRFTYWIERTAQGGEVLGPPDPAAELQVIDVRDLSPWIVDLAERGQPGIYNACGPAQATSFRQVLEELATQASSPVQFRWPDERLLQELGIELPMVEDPGTPDATSIHFSNEAAKAAGLRFRPLEETAADTLAWWRMQPEARRAAPRDWPPRDKELEALKRLAGT